MKTTLQRKVKLLLLTLVMIISPLPVSAASGVSAQLGDAVWQNSSYYTCTIDLSSSARMVTISVNNGYFTIPSLGGVLTFLGGTQGTSYVSGYNASTQVQSAVFSFSDVLAAEEQLGNIQYYHNGAADQTITATASSVSPQGNDMYFEGHFYRFIYTPDKISWPDAAVAAGTTVDPYFSGRGYLVTATNQAENSILLRLTAKPDSGWYSAWIGALWQRNEGNVASPIITRGTDGNEISYSDVLTAVGSGDWSSLLAAYSNSYGYDTNDSTTFICNNSDLVRYYWLDGPEAGQEIPNNAAAFAPWHVGSGVQNEPNSGNFVYIGWGGAYWDDLGLDDLGQQKTAYGYAIEFSGFDGGHTDGYIASDTKTVAAPYITTVNVTITAPAVGAIPQTVEQVEMATSNAEYTVSNVVWNEALTEGNSRFKADQVYTANITLTSKNGKVFKTEAFTPVVAGSTYVGTTTTNGTEVGNTVTFTVTFSVTAARTVTGIQTKNQPTDLIYTEGESLNLAGLEVTLTYNDSSTADVAAANFAANGITASPADGAVLTVTNHNGHTITLTCNVYNAITDNLTVNADTRTITGYYTDNSGSDTAITTTVTVPYGTTEVSAKAGLSTSGYAKLSDNSYVAVTIAWNFDTAYDGNSTGAKAVTGTVTGTFLGGQVPTNRTGTVTVEAELTYTVEAISDQTMTVKTAGYDSTTQETKTITVTRTGTGDLEHLVVSLSGGGSSNFVVTQPLVATLNSGTPFTTFTVKAKDGLVADTYTETVTVSADNMINMTFTVTQVVNPLFAPAIQSAVAGNEHVVITWNSVNEAAGYKIFCSNASGSYGTELATVSDSVYSYDATGLTNGTTYYFVVKASNGVVDSHNSNEVSVTPQVASPEAPVLQSANAGDGHVNVSWSVVVGSTGYKVYVSTTSGSYTTIVTTVAESIYSCDITGLTNGTNYYFTVKAINPSSDSAYSNEISAIPQVSVPASPTGLAATAGNARVTLSWDSVAGATGYKIYQSTTSGSYGAVFDAVTGSIYSYDATGLTNGLTYYFVIKATNAGGDSPKSAEVGSMPKTVPGTPTNVTSTAGNGEATVSFTAPADNGGSTITGYTVTSNPGNKIAIGISDPITVTGLTNGTTYTFTVTATNAAGTGAPSAASSAVTPHAPSSGDSSTTTQPTTQPLANTSADILVNGKTENAGTATTATEGNQTVTTIAVDEKKLEQKLEAEGNNAVVTISVNTKADLVVGELNGQIVQNMENKQAVLEVKTENATYTLPAQQINISAVSEQIGSGVELKDIKVQVEIAKAAAENVQLAENSAKQGEFSIIVPPVEFSVKCTFGGKTVEVSSFNAYVERTIAIPDGIDPNKITTGVIIDPDGTTRHVPTRVTIINGKYYAVINSLTNSFYSVVWNPLEFKDAANHWAKEAINDMGSRMVISGVGNGMSEPDRDITCAEFAAIIVRALGLKPGTDDNKFTDVNSSDWYYDYIKTAAEYKIISRYGNGKFGPNDKITREQAMTMIASTMNITGLKVQFADGEMDKLLANFKDAAESADYARDSIAACVKTGIIAGRNGNLIAPKENITRAEVVVIVRRLLLKSNLI